MTSAIGQLVKHQSPLVVDSLQAGGMSSVNIGRLVRIGVTEYVDDASKLTAAKAAKEVLRDALLKDTWLPSGPARVLHRKSCRGLAQLSSRTGHFTCGSSMTRRLLSDLMILSSRHRYTWFRP